ncbi:MAG: hypothetical protein BZY79_03490 [SAR202 cluster bacterium Casp-Chloro-G4]|nr:hypothetical protein [Chloroflexota bacterium]MDA1227827.1 hypothetical protein [Chloroflexota bacterium]PKB61439.1 MAG: hypothetical protein BZY79_03490 [SAR202 cluster bacterium Casp-Chloro-G4]
MSNKELNQGMLDALAQASGATTEPAMLSHIQASVDSIAGLDSLDVKGLEPAITFSVTESTSGGQS